MLEKSFTKLKEKEYDNISRISWDIGMKMRTIVEVNASEEAYKVFCLAYVAYVSKIENILDAKSLIKFLKENYMEDQFLFFKDCAKDLWTVAIEIGKKYSEDELLATIIWMPITNGRYGSDSETPESISKLACKLLNPHNEKVADFGCGNGSFLTTAAMMESENIFYGIDINTYRKEIADIRIGIVAKNAMVEQGTAFALDTDDMYDKIFCEHPLACRTNAAALDYDRIDELYSVVPELKRTTQAEWFYILNVIMHLSENGKAVVLTNNGTTWNAGVSKEIRERLIRLGYIEAVITLPSNMLTSTSVAVSLIVLSHNNKNIRMIDASSLAEKGRRQNTLSEDAINEIVSMMEKDTDCACSVSIENMERNEWAISPARFLENEVVVENGIPFENVIKKISRGSQIKASELDELATNDPTDIQYLMLANIKNGMISEDLPYLKELDKKLEKYCVKNNSLIISKNGVPIKVAIANVEEGRKILANGNLYVIELDEKKVNPLFIKAYLESEEGTLALGRLLVGSIMPNIPVESIKKMMIPMPDKSEQDRIAENYKAKEDEIKVLRYRLEKATEDLKKIFVEG